MLRIQGYCVENSSKMLTLKENDRRIHIIFENDHNIFEIYKFRSELWLPTEKILMNDKETRKLFDKVCQAIFEDNVTYYTESREFYTELLSGNIAVE